MTVGTACGEGANRTYVSLAVSSGSFLRAKRLNKIAEPVRVETPESTTALLTIRSTLAKSCIACRP